MANDKAKNNAYNRAQGQKYQAQAREYEAKHAANEEKLRRLREAKKKLETAITDYDTFKKNTEKIESDISESDFKGDIRNKFKTSVKTVTKDINSDINKHQANLSSLSGKIAGLELEQGNLLSWLLMRGIQQQTFSNHWSRRKLWEESEYLLMNGTAQ